MFDRIRRSANSTIEGIDIARLRASGASFVDADGAASQTAAHLAEQAKVAAGHARVAATDAAVQAKEAAVLAKEWSAPHLEATRDWLTPRIEHAWQEGVKAAAPKVELAAEKATPAIGIAHDRLVDELLPRLVAAVNDAAERAGAVIEQAADKAAEAPTILAAAAAEVNKPKHKHSGAKFFWIFTVLGAVAGGLVAWRRTKPTTDPWADPWEPSSMPARSADGHEHHDLQGAVGDAAEAVGEAAGVTVAKSREASKKAADKVSEVREDVTERMAEAREATKKVATRRRSAPNTVDAAADEAAEVVEDVTEAAGDTVEAAQDAVTKPADSE